MTKVSIVVPIFNSSRYLTRCIESLTSQTFKNLEIILVDDGSTDNSLEICNFYKLKDTRIKIIHKENGGLSEARNSGLDYAVGEYIIFVDSDDYCDKEFVLKMYSEIESFKSEIVICGVSIDYISNNYSYIKSIDNKYYFGQSEISELVYKLDEVGLLNYAWNKIYKKSILVENNLTFEKNAVPGEDIIFNSKYFQLINSANSIRDSLYHYIREDNDSLVTHYRKDLFDKIMYVNKKRGELYNFYDLNQVQHKKVFSYKYIENIEACLYNLFRKNSNLRKYEKIKVINEILLHKGISAQLKYFIPINFYDYLFKFLYKFKKSLLIYIIYKNLFNFRFKYDFLYREIRKNILTRVNN